MSRHYSTHGLVWVSSSNGENVIGAVSSGDGHYVGRFVHKGDLVPGKVHKSHGSCYIPYGM